MLGIVLMRAQRSCPCLLIAQLLLSLLYFCSAAVDSSTAPTCETDTAVPEQATQQQLSRLEAQLNATKEALDNVLASVHKHELRLAQLQHGTAAAMAAATAAAPQPSSASSMTGQHVFLPATSNLARTLLQRPRSWAHTFTMHSAVQADAPISAAHHMLDGAQGLPLYVVLGDEDGRLYFFTPLGELLYEYDTGPGIAVTAMTSYARRSNVSVLAVGRANGDVQLLQLSDTRPSMLSDDVAIMGIDLQLNSTSEGRSAARNSSLAPVLNRPIQHLEFIKSGPRRMLLVMDDMGQVEVLTEHTGDVRVHYSLDAQPLAVRTVELQVVTLTATGAVVTFLRHGRARIRRPCHGLSDDPDSALVAAAFDAGRGYRAYGLNGRGELLTMVVPADKRSSVCRVTHRQPLGLPPGPYRLATLPNRLIVAHAQGLALFDTSTSVRKSPQPLASHFTQELWALYGLQQHADACNETHNGRNEQQADSSTAGSRAREDGGVFGCRAPPLVVANGARAVVLSLGTRAAAVFALHGKEDSGRSSWAGSSSDSGSARNWLQMVQPLMVVVMMGVGVWQFLRASSSSSNRWASSNARLSGVGQRDMPQVLTGRYGGTRAGMGRRPNGVLGGSRAAAGTRAYEGGVGARGGGNAGLADADVIERLAGLDGRLREQLGRMSSIDEDE